MLAATLRQLVCTAARQLQIVSDDDEQRDVDGASSKQPAQHEATQTVRTAPDVRSSYKLTAV